MYLKAAIPLLPVVPLPFTVEPFDLVIVNATVAPATGWPSADTKAAIMAVWLRKYMTWLLETVTLGGGLITYVPVAEPEYAGCDILLAVAPTE